MRDKTSRFRSGTDTVKSVQVNAVICESEENCLRILRKSHLISLSTPFLMYRSRNAGVPTVWTHKVYQKYRRDVFWTLFSAKLLGLFPSNIVVFECSRGNFLMFVIGREKKK